MVCAGQCLVMALNRSRDCGAELFTRSAMLRMGPLISSMKMRPSCTGRVPLVILTSLQAKGRAAAYFMADKSIYRVAVDGQAHMRCRPI